MKRLLASTLLTAMLSLPGAAWAESVQDQIIAQLTEQGFVDYEVSRTLLGRVRIIATSSQYRREIVFNPTTGEILRDFIQFLNEDGGAAGPVLFDPSGQDDEDDDDLDDDGDDEDDDEEEDDEDDEVDDDDEEEVDEDPDDDDEEDDDEEDDE